MARRVDIGPRSVNGRMDGKRRRVNRLVTLDDKAAFIDEDEIRDADLAKVLGQGVQPKVVRVDGVADGNVASDAFVVASVGKDAKGGGEVGFAVGAFVVRGGEGWVAADGEGCAGVGFAEGLDRGGRGAGGGGLG